LGYKTSGEGESGVVEGEFRRHGFGVLLGVLFGVY
jgi:hypothetical protein